MKDTFITIATFEFSADVVIIKGRLESEGIQVFLADENTINSDPAISAALGGVKLQVYASDSERAMAIYKEVRAYAIGDDGLPIICPNCKAQKSEVYFERKGLFYKLFPFFELRKFKCLNCGMITKPD